MDLLNNSETKTMSENVKALYEAVHKVLLTHSKLNCKAMCAAQGGDLDAFRRLLKKPTFKFKIQAMKSGFVTAIDAEKVGKVALALGAGRLEKTDKIDPLAGITLAVKRGDRVSVGSPLATLESSREPDGLERCAADLLKAFTIGRDAPEDAGLVFERID